MSPKLSDLSYGEYIKALFVGKSGSWKTGAIGSFPEPIKILNWDGIDRLQTLKAIWPKKDIDYTNLSYEDVARADKELEKIRSNPALFATYGFDSFTFFMNHAIKYAMKHQQSKKRVGEISLMEIEHFNVEAAAANNLMDLIQKISGCHFLVTAHLIETQQKILGRENPMIDRKICTAGKASSVMLPGCFSEVYSFHLEPAIRVGDEPKPYIITKSGNEESLSEMEKTALPLPARLEYKGNLYGALCAELHKHGMILK